MRLLRVLFPLATAVFPATAPAQIRTFVGTAPNQRFGHDLDGAGDVDGDGFADVIVGAPFDIFFGCDTGQPTGARVFSGRTGAVLHEFLRPNSDDHHGVVVRGAGDVDADGHDDLLVANGSDFCCYGANRLFVYSGRTGAVLHELHVTWWYYYHSHDLDAAGDVNGDGHADFLIGDAGDDELFVHSGADASVLLAAVGPAGLGRSVRGVGDWDGDGLADVAASANSLARVYSGATGAIVFETPFAGVIDDPGDFDGDGLRDLLVSGFYSFDTDAVLARVLSGLDGSVLATFDGWTRYRAAGDQDGDGTVDFVAGDPVHLGTRGRAALLSGATGEVLALLREGEEPFDSVGYSVAPLGDVNADGLIDVGVGAVTERFVPGGAYTGVVRVWSGVCPPAPRRYCTAAPNSAGAGARIGHVGTWSVSNADLILRADGLPLHHFGIFFYGPAAAALPFGDGFRCVTGTPLVRVGLVGSGASGAVALPLDSSAPPHAAQLVPGATRFFQLWYRDTPAMQSGFNLTDALSIRFCP